MTYNKARANAMLAEARAKMAEAEALLKLADRFPAEPAPGAVLVFLKSFPSTRIGYVDAGATDTAIKALFDREVAPPVRRPAPVSNDYTYAALCIAPDVWYTTSQRLTDVRMSWDELVEFIGDSPCKEVTAYRTIPQADETEARLETADGGELFDRDAVISKLTRGRRTKAQATTMVDQVLKAAGLVQAKASRG